MSDKDVYPTMGGIGPNGPGRLDRTRGSAVVLQDPSNPGTNAVPTRGTKPVPKRRKQTAKKKRGKKKD